MSRSLAERIVDERLNDLVAELPELSQRRAELPAEDQVALRLVEAWSQIQARPGEVAAWAADFVRPLRRGHPWLGPGLMVRGVALVLLGDLHAAAPALERVLLFPQVAPWVRAQSLRFLASIQEIRGNLAESARLYREAVALYDDSLGELAAKSNARLGLAATFMRLGELDEADRHADAGERGLALANSPVLPSAVAVRAEIALYRGRPEGSLERLREAMAVSTGPFVDALAVAAGSTLIEVGSLDEAEQALSPPANLPNVEWTRRVLMSLLRIEQGRDEEARAMVPSPGESPSRDLASHALSDVLHHRAGQSETSPWRVVLRRCVDHCSIDLINSGLLVRLSRHLDPDGALQYLSWAARMGSPIELLATPLRAARERGGRVPLGPLRLESVLGSGAMGEVWSASSEEEGTRVAVKLLRSRTGRVRPEHRELFAAEVRAAASLDHPHIVQTLGELVVDPAAALLLEVPEGTPALVMELVAGGSLAQRGPLGAWSEARDLVLALLDALAHAHARGVLHLDVKPENLLVEEGPTRIVRLADFGLAGMRARSSDGRAFGTPAFMPPEQALGDLDRIGPWSDLYAVGGLTWWLVTGRPPFQGSALQVLADQISASLPPFEPRFPVPPDLISWLRGLLAKRPEDRFEAAADAASALLSLSRPPPLVAAPRSATTTWDFASDQGSESGWRTEVTLPFLAARVESGRTEARPPVAPPPPGWRVTERRRRQTYVSGLGSNLYPYRRPRLQGREQVLDRVWAALGQARTTGRGTLVAVDGVSGVGLSYPLEVAAERAEATGAAEVLRGLDAAPPTAPGRRPRLALAGRLDASDLPRVLSWTAAGAVVLAEGSLPGALLLEPLSRRALGEVLGDLVPLTPALRERLVDRAEGNVAFAVGLLADLVRREQLIAGSAGFELREGARLEMGRDRLEVVTRQLDDLGAEGSARRSGWELGAILGAVVNMPAWESAARRAALGDASLWEPLFTAGLARRKGSQELYFTPPLVREALVAGAAQSGRGRLWHELAAQVVPSPAQRAEHWVEAGWPEEALPWAWQAAQEAGGAEADAWFDRWWSLADALVLPADDPRRLQVQQHRQRVRPPREG